MRIPDFLPCDEIRRFSATPQGLELLAGSTALQGAVIDFCQATDHAELAMAQSAGQRVGGGSSSEVWDVDGVAVKVSTPSTRGADAPKAAGLENLIIQMRFLHELGAYLRREGCDDIVVPAQYFALRSRRTNSYLLAQEHMADWISLDRWMTNAAYSPEQRAALQVSVKGRLSRWIGDSVFSDGVSDIISVDDKVFNADNLLVPRDTEDPYRTKLCIIDQPSRGRANFGTQLGRISLGLRWMERLFQGALFKGE